MKALNLHLLEQQDGFYRQGRVLKTSGLLIIATLPGATVGELCLIQKRQANTPAVKAEVIAIDHQNVKLMPFESLHGLRFGDKVEGTGKHALVPGGTNMLGLVVDSFGRELRESQSMGSSSPLIEVAVDKVINPLSRKPITENLATGVRAIDTFCPFGKGQRLGIMAGSGVGKSTLLSLIASHLSRKNTAVVAVLVGERGREVEEFVNHQLDSDTKSRTAVIVATAEEMPVTRVLALKYGISLAESISQEGTDVLLLVDSMTRVAMAQREIGLSMGEPTSSKGYTPSVFSLLQQTVERCGHFEHRGAISGLFTILVDGGDLDDPVVDALRASLDGHIVLDRNLAEKGHYPAINVLTSLSRLTSALFDDNQRTQLTRIKKTLSAYNEKKMMIDLSEAEGSLSSSLRQLSQANHEINTWLAESDVSEIERGSSCGLEYLSNLCPGEFV
ncbi:FliI/YscN family ATPase [Aestuariibacter sp. AA17]|uniref:protein-secreting ATPase n=1 Tax=Fluctibacter corallii TaxID=2984329 RepID=A0ABT3A9F3_9ALTE|nr:FliI/YscN family ATPase [Aestuariibacter sp. AA17]MCV2885312.1 FliI/YscN family ATPase [Aestuariibacter sp. AA17]